jgi:hypothetical protein
MFRTVFRDESCHRVNPTPLIAGAVLFEMIEEAGTTELLPARAALIGEKRTQLR